jgi:hypothetical protein
MGSVVLVLCTILLTKRTILNEAQPIWVAGGAAKSPFLDCHVCEFASVVGFVSYFIP